MSSHAQVDRHRRRQRRAFQKAVQRYQSTVCVLCCESICHENNEDIVVTSCDHVFHCSCWISYSGRDMSDRMNMLSQVETPAERLCILLRHFFDLNFGLPCPLCRTMFPTYHECVGAFTDPLWRKAAGIADMRDFDFYSFMNGFI